MSIYIFPVAHPTAPEIISLSAAKLHLKVDTTDDDTLITDLIQAAIESAENYTGISINEAKFEVKSDCFINDHEFKVSPVQSITSVKYLDEDGNEQTLATAKYELLPIDKYVQKIQYPDFDELPTVKEDSSKAVVVALTTGYADGKVPKAIQSAIKLIIGDLYENRQDRADKLPKRSESLLRKYRLYY